MNTIAPIWIIEYILLCHRISLNISLSLIYSTHSDTFNRVCRSKLSLTHLIEFDFRRNCIITQHVFIRHTFISKITLSNIYCHWFEIILHDNSQFYNIVNCVERIFKVSFQHCQIYNIQIHPLICKDLKVSGQWSVDWLVIVLTTCLDIFRLNNKMKQHKRANQKPTVFKVCFSFKLQGWFCLHFKRCLWINIS